MKRLVVIDGKSVFYRGYYAMPGLSMVDGTPTGGVYGFVSLAIDQAEQNRNASGTRKRRQTAALPKRAAQSKR